MVIEEVGKDMRLSITVFQLRNHLSDVVGNRRRFLGAVVELHDDGLTICGDFLKGFAVDVVLDR